MRGVETLKEERKLIRDVTAGSDEVIDRIRKYSKKYIKPEKEKPTEQVVDEGTGQTDSKKTKIIKGEDSRRFYPNKPMNEGE